MTKRSHGVFCKYYKVKIPAAYVTTTHHCVLEMVSRVTSVQLAGQSIPFPSRWGKESVLPLLISTRPVWDGKMATPSLTHHTSWQWPSKKSGFPICFIFHPRGYSTFSGPTALEFAYLLAEWCGKEEWCNGKQKNTVKEPWEHPECENPQTV